MAFPTHRSLGKTWDETAQAVGALRTYLVEFVAASAERAMSTSDIEGIFTRLGQIRVQLQETASRPGIAAYVQNEYADEELDIGAEYTALMAEIESAIQWIASAMPQSNGYVLTDQWTSDGTIERRTFSTQDLAGLRATLQDVIDTIGEPA